MQQPNLTLTLPVEDVNLILEGLGNMPYVKVCNVVTTIQQQAHAQIQATADSEDEDCADEEQTFSGATPQAKLVTSAV